MTPINDPAARSGIDEAALDRAVRRFDLLLLQPRRDGLARFDPSQRDTILCAWIKSLLRPIAREYHRIMMGDFA